MAEFVDFGMFAQEKDPEEMTREELLEMLEAVRQQIAQLDESEPEDMESEEYDQWGDQHEELEDLAEELEDCLETLRDD